MKTFSKEQKKQIECMNNALVDVSTDMVRMHICWGNYEGPHTHDISLEKNTSNNFKSQS